MKVEGRKNLSISVVLAFSLLDTAHSLSCLPWDLQNNGIVKHLTTSTQTEYTIRKTHSTLSGQLICSWLPL
jgi:hypothetical protein